MPNQIKTARLFLIASGCLMLATAGLLLFIFLTGAAFVGAAGEKYELLGSAVLGSLGHTLCTVAAIFGAFNLIAAAGVSRGKKWGRFLGLFLSILMLPLVPIGTIFGLFALTGLLGSGARTWFDQGGRTRGARNAAAASPGRA